MREYESMRYDAKTSKKMPMDRHHVGGGSPVEICAPLLCSWVHFGGYCVTWNLLRGASGGLEGSLEGRTGVFTASWNLFGCFQKRIWDLLELLWELLRKTRGINNGLRRPYARSYLKYV